MSFLLPSLTPPTPRNTLFPYTTLFRSDVAGSAGHENTLQSLTFPRFLTLRSPARPGAAKSENRSEEHTSELQSHVNLVCRLLLEKKKTRIISTLCRDRDNAAEEENVLA